MNKEVTLPGSLSEADGMAKRTPMYGMSDEQEMRFFSLAQQLRSLGYWVSSEPLEGNIEGWLAGVERNLATICERLEHTNRAFRTRGRSKAARYYLTSNETFDPGFGISLTLKQQMDNKDYAAKLARAVAKWDAGEASQIEPDRAALTAGEKGDDYGND